MKNQKNYINSKKYYLIGLANSIRQSKIDYKEKQRNHELGYHEIVYLKKMQYEYRHQHIAYCLAKKSYPLYPEIQIYNGDNLNSYGKHLYKIENKTRENNEPNFKYIRQLVDEYFSVQEIQDEKIVCLDEE